MDSKIPLIQTKAPQQWKHCCYNYFILIAIPVMLLAAFVIPLQLIARFMPSDFFALFVLTYSIGILWCQFYAIGRMFTNVQKNWVNYSTPEIILSLAYKLISITIALAASNFALILIRLTCPGTAPFLPIRSCFTVDCSYLYITSTACYYWYIAVPIIEISMQIFATNIGQKPDIPQSIVTA
jgi:hypothetical protein